MIYSLLMVFFIIISALLILLVLIQQGKGNMGLGNLGGATQMLFGGTGGQDIFQKTTWVLGTLFMALSFVLAVMKTKEVHSGGYDLFPAQQQAQQLDSATEEL